MYARIRKITEKLINFYELEFEESGNIIDHNKTIKVEEDDVRPFNCSERKF